MSKKILMLLFLMLVLISVSAVSAVDVDDNKDTIVSSADAEALVVENDVDAIDDLSEDVAGGGDETLVNDSSSVSVGKNNEILQKQNSDDDVLGASSEGVPSEVTGQTTNTWYVNASATGGDGKTSETAYYTINLKNNDPTPVIDTCYVNASAAPGGDGSEAKPFNTLNAALTAAQDGDTIMIASGEYTGTNNTGLGISKKLNFIKYGDDEAIFDAEKQRRIWTVTATSINITGLTFKNGKSGEGGAIYIANQLRNFNINAKFIGNTANSGAAIHFEQKFEFIGNINGIFVNNTAQNSGAAISVEQGSFAGNINGSFINNKAAYGGAVYIDQDFTGNIRGIFINNKGNSGGGAIELEHGTMSGNITGIFINNTADRGGAIYTDESDTDDLLIQDSIFINNKDNIAGSDYSSYSVFVINSWFGNNAANYNTAPIVGDGVIITDWLFLNATADPVELNVGENSTIKFRLDSYNDISKNTSSYDASKMGIILELSQTFGELNKNTTLIGEEVIYTANQEGNPSVTGKVGTAYYTINLKNTVKLLDANWTYINIYTGKEEDLDGAVLFLPWDYVPTCYVKYANGTGLPAGTNITIFCDGDQDYTINTTVQDGGMFSVNVSDIALGKYRVTFSSKGYKTATATINIVKALTEIAVDNETVSLIVGGEVGSGATLTPADAGNLTYAVSNSSVVKVENGKIIALAVGNATIIVSFAGNDRYFAADNKTIVVNVIPPTLNLNASYVVSVSDDGFKIKFTICSDPVISGNLTVKFNGKAYPVEMVNGTAVFTTDKVYSNKYPTDILYGGSSYYSNSSAHVDAVVKSTKVSRVNTFTYYYYNNDMGSDSEKGISQIKVVDSDGKPLKGAVVTITIMKKYKLQIKTNAEGIAKFTRAYMPGTYSVTATYNNKVTSLGNLVLKSVVNVPKVTTVKKSSKTTTIKITLKGTGPLKGKTAKVIFMKKTYLVKTNNQGVATFKVTKAMVSKLAVGKTYNLRVTYRMDSVLKSIKIAK